MSDLNWQDRTYWQDRNLLSTTIVCYSDIYSRVDMQDCPRHHLVLWVPQTSVEVCGLKFLKREGDFRQKVIFVSTILIVCMYVKLLVTMNQDTKEFHNPFENSKFNNRYCKFEINSVTWRQIPDMPRVIILCNYYLIKNIKVMWP